MRLLHTFDYNIATKIRRLPGSWRPFMLSVSTAGEPVVIILIGLAGYSIALQRHHQTAARAFIYAAVAYGLNIALKLILHRRRPHGRIIRTLGIQSYSFPSGHAFGVVILYGLLAYLAFNHINGLPQLVLGILLICLIFTTGLSRVYLGSHYPSDVLAGWALGAISLMIVVGLA